MIYTRQEILDVIDKGLERCKRDPKYAKEIMIGAGIWDKDGNLTERYK